jgi:uncharacterized membrane protein YeaQ/YmgE (transglycosylase-associated protein family)
MNSKPYLWIGMVVGSYVGAYIPTLFGVDMFSGWSIFWSAVGAFAGLYLGYKAAQYWG